MKKYTQSATRSSKVCFLICLFAVLAGVLLACFAPDRFELILLLLGLGIPLGFLSLTVYIACRSVPLLLEEEAIVFPITRAPKLRFKRNRVRYDEIKRIERHFYKGDGLISGDTNFYRFVLKNGITFTETFFSYGKRQEQEIVDILKEKGNLVDLG